jgi:cystathionine gamma-synthase
MKETLKVETLAVHAGGAPDPATGAVSPPIVLSTTYEHGPASEPTHGFMYIREDNPTQVRLEEALAAIEGGEAALAFASGMAAGTALLQALPVGAHVLLQDDLYYDFRNVAREYLPRWGMSASAADMGNLDAVAKALRPETKLVWLETPSNPLMKVCDIAAVAGLAHARGARVVVDGTFAPPTIQRPLELGADAVLHSTTKYLGGHSDVQGGGLVFREGDRWYDDTRHHRKVLGGVASPFNSWLVLRGLRSLGCRVERHCANALQVARALRAHPAVSAVHYPGLESHAGHEVARRQMKAFGGMLSFQVRAGRAAAVRAVSRVRLFLPATSLGGTESLIEHRRSSEGPTSQTPDDLLRVSVGLEHPDDLVADLQQALEG